MQQRARIRKLFHDNGSAGIFLERVESGNSLKLYIGMRSAGFSGTLRPAQSIPVYSADKRDKTAFATLVALEAAIEPLLCALNWLPKRDTHAALAAVFQYLHQAEPAPSFPGFVLVRAGLELTERTYPSADAHVLGTEVEEVLGPHYVFSPEGQFNSFHVIVRPGAPVAVEHGPPDLEEME